MNEWVNERKEINLVSFEGKKKNLQLPLLQLINLILMLQQSERIIIVFIIFIVCKKYK